MPDPDPRPFDATAWPEVRDDRLCDRFEFLLKAGQGVEVDDFLRAEGLNPADHPDLAAHLGRVEAHYRADGETRGFAAASVGGPADLHPGMVFDGKYTLIKNIGGGGMGEVWAAQQERPVKRLVAVKVIKPGMDSRAVLARFDAERQALAVMDHTNIAKVYDAGTTPAGRPYFVMELVKGVSITKFCDTHTLTPKQRLALFVDVCEAIQHAHLKGIIHRDIKPSNVMVAMTDGRPVVKVIDFGIAKAVGDPLSEHTFATGQGAVVGTPEYMSPEQAGLNQQDVDTRSDVYSLGVLLYELLTGTTPIDRRSLKKAALAEVLRMVREVDAPRPSDKLSSSAHLPSIAATRGTEPKKLTSEFRGEVDWILLRALEKDRRRRYESANALAADVQRHLNNEVVGARPPTTGYKVRKFVRRNRGPVIAAAAVFVALLGGVVGTTLGLIEAKRGRDDAIESRGKEAIQRGIAEANERVANANAAEAVASRNDLWDGLDAMTSTVVEDSLATQPAVGEDQKRFLASVLPLYRKLAEKAGRDEAIRARAAHAAFHVGKIETRLGRKREAVAAYEQARDEFALLSAEFPAVPVYRRQLAGSHGNLAILHGELGNIAAAEDQMRNAVTRLEQLVAEHPAVTEYRAGLAVNHNNLGNLLYRRRKPVEAELQYRKAQAIQMELTAEFPTVPAHHAAMALTQANLGNLRADSGNRVEAEKEFRAGLVIQERLAAEFPAVPQYRAGLAITQTNLGALLSVMGKHPEAVEQFRKAIAQRERLSAEYPAAPEYRIGLATTHDQLGRLFWDLGKRSESVGHHKKALPLWEQWAADFTTTHECRQQLAGNYTKLGNLLWQMGEHREAAEHHKKALSLLERLTGEFPNARSYRVDLGGSYCNLGLVARDSGNPLASLDWFGKAIATLRPAHLAEPRDATARLFLQNSHSGRGMAYTMLRRHPEAASDWGTVVGLCADNDRAWANYQHGAALDRAGETQQATAAFDRALKVRQAAVDEAGPDAKEPHRLLAICLLDIGIHQAAMNRHEPAAEWFGKAVVAYSAFADKWPGPDATDLLRWSHQNRAVALGNLGRQRNSWPDWDRAVELCPKEQTPGVRAERATAWVKGGRAAEAVAEVTELRRLPGWNAGQIYAFACLYALASVELGDKNGECRDAAVGLVRQAVKAGYRNAAWVKTDPDLHPIRGHADFAALLADLEKGNALQQPTARPDK